MIGILIALQINNWNEERKAFIKEQSLYKKLIIDLESEDQQIKEELHYLKLHQDLHYSIYEQTKEDSKADTIKSFNPLQWIIIYHPKIKENYITQLDEISNDSIRDLIKRYISTEETAIDAYEEYNEYKTETLRPYFSRNGILNTAPAFNDTPYEFMSLDEIELINREKLRDQYGSEELDQILFNLRFKTAWQIHNMNKLDKNNRTLISILEERALEK